MQTTIRDAFFTILGQCDGAHSLDAVGFNAPDAVLARKIARRADVWGAHEDYAAHSILRKYSGQLAARGIDCAALPVPEKPEKPQSARLVVRVGETQNLKVIFDYNTGLVSAVKQIPGARFDGASKSWTIPYTAQSRDKLIEFVDSRDFELSVGAIDLLNSEPGAPPAPVRKVTAQGKEWRLAFAYDAALVTAVKALTSRRRFDPDTKSWVCEGSAALLSFCEQYGFDGREALAASLAEAGQQQAEIAQADDALTQALLDAVGDLSASLPGARQIVLRKYQQEAVMGLLARKRAILAHDMGLGKSLTALVAAKAAQQALDAHVFVVAPISLRTNWMREAEEAGVAIEFFSWAKVPQAPAGDSPVVVIFDEAHFCQSLKSQRTQGALALADKALMAFFLTGTPIKNGRPVNLFPLLKGCQHGLATNKTAYEKRYCAAKETRWTKWDVSGAAHLDELHQRTQDVLFRKTKAQCLDLPALTRVKREAEVSAEAAAAYETAKADIVAKIQARPLLKGSEALELLTALRVAGSKAKSDTAIELAEEVVEQDGQVIVSTQFQATALTIAQALGCEALTGATPGEDRQAMVDRFQAGQRKAIVFTGGAGGVGLNLQAANTVILVDRPWTPGDAEQIESRAHRSGVNHPVTSIWLQYNSVDAKIDALLELKQTRIEQVLEGERKTMRGVSKSLTSVALEALGIELDDAE